MGFFRRHQKNSNKTERRRLYILGLVFSFLIVIVLFRLFTYQVWKREPWKSLAPGQYQRRVKLIARRGIIYDRDMNILAMDLPISSLAVDPTQIKNIHATCSALARVLGGDEKTYEELVEKKEKKSFVKIKQEITEEQKRVLIKSKIPGLIFLDGRKRVHPCGTLALPVLGIVNRQHRGVGGVEQAMDRILRGEDGWAVLQKDGLNRKFSSVDYPVEKPINGKHVVLTIDHVYQTIVEEELRRGVIEHRARGGSAVLMDPFTGEVLAMASVLGDEVKGKKDYFEKLMQNQAVQIAFEPGSTFKIVTASAALQEGFFRPNSLVHCENGAYHLAGYTIHDHNKGYAWLTLSQILEYSSNIGMAKVGRKIGKKILYKYAQDFGFGNRTGIGLPGEVSGILRPVYQWSDFSTATISFGQGVSVTTLQIACMVSAVANGGELLKPRIFRAVLDEKGRELKTFPEETIRRVISQNTADKMKTILEKVVEYGSGTEARVEGIRIAGKTGTAQKSVPGFKGYVPGAYVSSFVGFWPVDVPAFVLVIVLDEPKGAYWGARSAAPVFARIVRRIVGLPTAPWSPGKMQKKNPEKKFVFSSFYKRENNKSQIKRAVSYSKIINSKYVVPRVIGLSVREALQKLSGRGIEITVEGSGIVVEQKPKPGSKFVKGMVCRLICREKEEGG